VSQQIQIKTLIGRVLHGEVRIPGFQRDFVWEPQRAALLMDSIYKEYPFGTILLWRSRTALKTEKKLGSFVLPDPEDDYPLDYVLDGQQRVTSIFGTFQTELPAAEEHPDRWLPIYYDFGATQDAQDSQFVALATAEVDPDRHFPLATFFDPVRFSTQSRSLSDPRLEEIVNVQSRFSGALVPVETFETDDRGRVAIVFERVNRMGIELDMFQLLTAWTWSDDFDLQDKFNQLAEEFEAFGFADVGSDNDLMLRCCAAILRQDPSPASLIDINGTEVRQNFNIVTNALRLAVDFLRNNLEVRHLKFLPYSALLIPLSAFFSIDQGAHITDTQREALLRWFWRTSFSHRYSGNPLRNVKNDVVEAINLRRGEPSTLDAISATISEEFYLDRAFSAATVASKTFILQLARHRPRSFMSGQPIDLDDVLSEPNRKEYHHSFPKAYLLSAGYDLTVINCIANFAFLNRAENRKISAKAPSLYRLEMPDNSEGIQKSQLLPDSLFADDWDTFRHERAQLLVADASQLLADPVPS